MALVLVGGERKGVRFFGGAGVMAPPRGVRAR